MHYCRSKPLIDKRPVIAYASLMITVENQKIDYAVKARRLLELLETAGVSAREGTILDYGCGDGDLTLELSKLGLDALGVDIIPEHIAAARKRFELAGLDPWRIRHLNVDRELYKTEKPYSLPFDTDSISTVLSVQVFEHISDLESVLSELARILKPGGTIYAEFPAALVPLEPHIKIPFAHWLPYSTLRATYIDAFYKAGFGLFRSSGGKGQNEYLRTGVFYRPNHKLDRLFGRHFSTRSVGALRIKSAVSRRNWPVPPDFVLNGADRLMDLFYERSLLLQKK
jgi:SAM-dependent methyltransferase